jgi:hypothetical protein
MRYSAIRTATVTEPLFQSDKATPLAGSHVDDAGH